MINKEDILTILKNIKDENNSKKVDSYIFRINEKMKELEHQILNVIEGQEGKN